MPSFELSKLQAVTGARALSDTDRTAIEARSPQSGAGAQEPASSASATTGVSLEIGAAINGGINAATPPVNADRVAQIREALRDGVYPLKPAEIADAMIAAQLSFVVEQ